MTDSGPLGADSVRALLEALVRTPSVNPTLAPGEGSGEAAVAALACAWLEARGVRAWLEEAAPGRPNAVAEVGDGDGDGPTLVLCAHLDTVSTAGMTIPPFEPRVEHGRLYGRGSYDMKGGVAAAMSAAAALARAPFHGRVLLALVADEEYASIGAEAFVRAHRADACILTEPSEGRLVLAHKGFAWIEVVTHGRAAHGSRWDLGESAIGRMGRIVAALEAFDRDTLRSRTHPLVGPASMHCAVIAGGSGLSTYAAECTLQIERRTLPGETPEGAVEEIAAVIRTIGEQADVRLPFARTPMVCDRDAPIARAVRDAAGRVHGVAPEEIGVAFWMDAAIFDHAGIPTVDYGPTGAGAHEAVEWVELDSVVRCARVLTEAAIAFCANQDAAAATSEPRRLPAR